MASQNNGNQIMQAPAKVKVTSKDFAAKYKSKREVYNFLSVDCGIYLPSYGKWASYRFLIVSVSLLRLNQHLLPEGCRPGTKEE